MRSVILFFFAKCEGRNYKDYIKELRNGFIGSNFELRIVTEEVCPIADISFENYTSNQKKAEIDRKINLTKIVTANRFWTNFSEVDIWPYQDFTEEHIQKIIDFSLDVTKGIDLAFIGHYDNSISIALGEICNYKKIKNYSPYIDYWHKRLYVVNPSTYVPEEILNLKVKYSSRENVLDFDIYQKDVTEQNKEYDQKKFRIRVFRRLKNIQNKSFSEVLIGALEITEYIKSLIYFKSEIPKCNFIFFAMHMQPEALLFGPGKIYQNQFAVISWIASNLPFGYKLVVKEYPTVYSRRAEYYRRISQLHNVVLVSRKISSAEILHASRAVVTISGTVGFEALLNRKNVVLIGDSFFQDFPNVYKNNENIFAAMFDAITTKFDQEAFLRHLGAYQKALEELSVPIPSEVLEKNWWWKGEGESYFKLVNKLIDHVPN